MTVASGDTLSLIARRCGTTIPVLLKANPTIRNPDIIHLGTVLTIPGGAPVDVGQPPDEPYADTLSVEPFQITPGGRATLTVVGLPLKTRVWVKGGSSQSPKHQLILRGARTDKDGRLRVMLRIPQWLSTGPGEYNISVVIQHTGDVALSSSIDMSRAETAPKASGQISTSIP